MRPSPIGLETSLVDVGTGTGALSVVVKMSSGLGTGSALAMASPPAIARIVVKVFILTG